MTPLRQAMIDECRLRGFAQRTEDTYLYAVEQLSRHYHQRPDTITEAQLEQYFRYLTLEKQLARGQRLESLEGGRPEMQRTLERAQRFLRVLAVAQEEGVEAAALEEVQVVARHLPHRAQLAATSGTVPISES